ncbi:MAG: sigma-54-dependent Fis family transcriptional regulator [Candidatus Parabeggiatoa sp. nov. 2]|nr:MAG: sigma-54-dependent Fis family transcriptional regulator [Beggiatoa sp. 4572_84]RKZ58006.1 MAG: sigma-54-dependent Fis family transcriptional regulator [Gammaproteobacteria bacterium]
MRTQPHPSVLLVEDDVVVATTYKSYLYEEQVNLTHVETGAAVFAYLQKNIPNAILLDLGLPDMNGMEILKYVQQQQLGSAVIITTSQNSVEVVVKAMRYGAFDFIEKPFTANRLIVTLRNALRQSRLSQLVDYYTRIGKRDKYYDFIGASEPMQAIYHIIDNVAKSNASVFITGESGTGKELCADAIHKQGQRKDKPFIPLNCAAIPKELMESQIFGHIKGAFTGANQNQAGAASIANGGTLFLDEIGDMDLDLQSKLLRFIQTGTIQKVGSSWSKKVDIRFICATHYDPIALIESGHFREDLYYRLNVIPIHLPPLRERGDDVLLIGRQFLIRYATEEHKSFVSFAPETEAILKDYEWPGNVRQLQNVIRRTVVLNEGQVVTPEMLPSLEELPTNRSNARHFQPTTSVHTQLAILPTSKTIAAPPSKILPLWQAEKELIEQAIEACGGDISKAATLLEIDASTIYRKRRENWRRKTRKRMKIEK